MEAKISSHSIKIFKFNKVPVNLHTTEIEIH